MRRFIAATVIRPVTTTMVTIAVLVFGFVGLTRLPVDLLPDLSYPTITIRTEFPDAAPLETEELVTVPIEERVSAVPGVIDVESISREGESEVVLDFAWGTRIDQAMADVREKLDRVSLPTTATRPLVLRYDPSQEPILRLALQQTGRGSVSLADLALMRRTADVAVKRELEKLPGVAAVELHGGQDDEVVVELDPARLAALQVTTQDVAQALLRDNVNRPGGAVTDRGHRYLIRTLHEARTPAQLAEIIVRSQDGAELRVRDLGRVYRAPAEIEELSFVGGREVVELAVYREGDANIVGVARQVQDALPSLALPPGQSVVVLSNRAAFIESAVVEVQRNTLVGGALAIAVLLFFLRDLRATAVIALAIPISLLAAFIPLQALGVSLNVMSLGGLALGVGMLVDNSIVVLEAIARVREHAPEDSRPSAAIQGTTEVAASVVASTLTTVAVFFPMTFVEGVAGQLVHDLAYAVSFSMLSSMLVSLTLVPVLMGLGQGDPTSLDDDAPRSALVFALAWLVSAAVTVLGGLLVALGWLLTRVAYPFTALYDLVESTYGPLLRGALRVRWLVILVAAGLCVYAFDLVRQQDRTLLPELDQDEFFVQVTLPRDASLPRTARAVTAMSEALADDPRVALRFARVGSISVAHVGSGTTNAPYLAQIGVRLRDDIDDRDRVAQALFARIQASNPEPGATLVLGKPSLIAFAPPIELLVFADEPALGRDYARGLLPELTTVEGLTDVLADDLEGRPEVRVDFDRERLGRLGLSVDEAALAVQRAIQGEVATTMYAGDAQLDVRVMLPRDQRSRPDVLQTIPIAVVDGVTVTLGAIATISRDRGPAQIRRIDGRRGLRIRARTDSLDLGGIASEVEDVLNRRPHEPTVQAEVSGQAGQIASSTRSLLLAAALSVFLVYVVMASSFESLLHPFLILFTVPLALAGAVVALRITAIPISVMVGIGVIVLTGIVVNNAIVLINAVNDRRGRGMPVRDALLEAGRVRVRPIIMTTLTTVLGLVPMALGLGDGAALRQPLAVSIIGGLLLATLLTLVVIPCVYSLVPGPRREAWSPETSVD